MSRLELIVVHRLSGAAQEKLMALEEVRNKWARVHRLVEESAAKKSGQKDFWSKIRRLTTDLDLMLTNMGLGQVAEKVQEMDMVIRRPTMAQAKVRGMREVVGKVKDAIDTVKRDIEIADRRRAEFRAARERKARNQEPSAPPPDTPNS